MGGYHQEVTRSKCCRAAIVTRLHIDAERQAARLQLLEVAGGVAQERRVVAHANIAEDPGAGVEFGEENRREAAATQAVCAGVAIQARNQLSKRTRRRRQGPQAGLEPRHQQGGRNALGGHGDVLRGKEIFELGKQCFRDLMNETAEAYAQGARLDEARKRVAAAFAEKYKGKSSHVPSGCHR